VNIVFFGTSGGVQSAEDSNVSFLILYQGNSILVDVSGSPVQSLKKVGINPLELDCVVITHEHTDHIYALPSLIHNLWLMKREKPLTIITNTSTERKAKELCNLFSLLSREALFPMKWVSIEEGKHVVEPGVEISLFPVVHSVSTSGLKISTSYSSIVYSSDTSPCEKVGLYAKGAKMLIHESSGSVGEENVLNKSGHSSARQAGEIAERAGVKTLVLCHFDFSKREYSTEQAISEAKSAFRGLIIIPDSFKSYLI